MLSFAMMVKNEEANLGRCIKSLAAFLPEVPIEIVILDTGSTDKTVEIAKKYTQRVFFQPWQDNFSLHRNKSFSYCRGDWIFQIDADEELIFPDPRIPQHFYLWLQSLPKEVHAIGVPFRDFRPSIDKYTAESDLIRVFRNGKVTYRRRVHNDPVYSGKVALYQGFFLKHYGYDLTDEQKKVKAKRTVTLLHESIKDDPTDYQSYFYLAQASVDFLGDVEAGVEYARKYIEHKDDVGDAFNAGIYYFMAWACYIKDDFENCKHWIDQGVSHNPQVLDIDLSYVLMLYGIKTKDAESIVKGATAFILAYENFDKVRKVSVGKNFFWRTPSAYLVALYHITRYHLGNASIGIKKIDIVLPTVGKELADEVSANIKAICKELGLNPNSNGEDNDKPLIITPSHEAVAKYSHKTPRPAT